MIHIEYPSMQEVESDIKKMSDGFKKIKNLSDSEAEELSSKFYGFLDQVGKLAKKHNLDAESVKAYYKGLIFLQI
jgi:hypothetical protein